MTPGAALGDQPNDGMAGARLNDGGEAISGRWIRNAWARYVAARSGPRVPGSGGIRLRPADCGGLWLRGG